MRIHWSVMTHDGVTLNGIYSVITDSQAYWSQSFSLFAVDYIGNTRSSDSGAR